MTTNNVATAERNASDDKGALRRKWGPTIIEVGFTAVPDILLRRMGKLGIAPAEMVVLLQILSYWWDRDQLPFPSKKTIADAMGVDPKTVQKHIGRLVKAGFLRRTERPRVGNRHESNTYDFTPLIKHLEPEAKEEAIKINEAKAAKAEKTARMRQRGRATLASVK